MKAAPFRMTALKQRTSPSGGLGGGLGVLGGSDDGVGSGIGLAEFLEAVGFAGDVVAGEVAVEMSGNRFEGA